MKIKLTTLLFSLLLAVGWTSSASAQLKDGQPLQLNNLTEFLDKGPVQKSNVKSGILQSKMSTSAKKEASKKAPSRTPNTVTADVTHPYSWYDAITYDWVDANGNPKNSKITEPATTAEQMAYLLGTTYMNPNIPGIQYTEGWETIHPYNNIGYGWDIPNNARWNYDGQTDIGYGDIIITPDASNMQYISYTRIYSIRVVSGSTTITSWDYATNGNRLPSGWSFTGSNWGITNDYHLYANTTSRDHYITIPGTMLIGYSNVQVVIVAKDYNYYTTGYRRIIVNDQVNSVTTNLTSSDDLTYTWNITSNGMTKLVTKPYENGYTVFLVKVKDDAPKEPYWVYSWNDLINYFDTHIDEVQLLTDGTRLNEGTDDAGTMFSYSGELNRFYFASKGKMFYIQSDCAPTNSMYEEFSAHQPGEDAEDVTDFYSKLLYGNSYNVIHDCQGVNPLQHYFSMSGKAGTEHKSMTNLVFWIPDNRGVSGTRNYDEEYLPHVGLYTIVLEAEAEPAADYSTSNRMYDVTLDWVSSLDNILDFDVDQDYELWVYIYDENGNPVKKEKLIEHLQDQVVHNETTYTYQVPQEKESYTIYYRVHGWPKDAKNTPGYYPDDPKLGNFYALSNIDPVLIPGYENFLALGLNHYESDFLVAEEHNYYRNFLSLDNQNPNNALTAKRIEDGENLFTLYRFDGDKPNQLTKAADLLLSVDGNKVNYRINYANQFYVDDADQSGISTNLTGYKDLYAQGYPTSGTIATISEGGTVEPPVDYYVKVTNTEDITNDGEYLIVNENAGKAMNGSLTNFNGSGTNAIDVTIREDNTIESNATTDAATFTFSGSGDNRYVKSHSGYYIGRISGSSGGSVVQSQTTGYNHTIQLNEDGSTFFRCNDGTTYWYHLRYNSTSQQFRYYANTGQQPVYLYKKVSENTDGLLNNFLDNSTYTQVGMVVFQLPWKSINVKLQDESAGTSAGYFMIQSGGKLRFVMPSGFNNASLRFVVHNAPVSSNYYDGTFTLKSSTGETHTIEIPSGGTVVNGDRDYEVIFTGISSGDVITITGTHTVNGTTYSYSPDFKYIHVYVTGGHDGISKNDALNLAGIEFVDQFKAETKEDKHPYRYGYVLKYEGTTPQESAKPEVPVQHAGASLDGYYTLKEIQEDTKAPLLQVNVMNAEVLFNLTKNPQVYYYTLERKPSTADTEEPYEEISKMQKREDDSYMEMDDKLGDAETVFTTALAPRFDNYDMQIGQYNDYMSYVPVVWTHGELPANRRVKWESEQRHNSYGAPIWKTGVAEVKLTSVVAERQENSASTTWTYGNEECNLYMLKDITAVATMPTANNVKYVPYMFRIFVKSDNEKLRGYKWYAEGEGTDPNKPGSHYEGIAIDDPTLQCVWSSYVNDPSNADYGVTFGESTDDNGAKIITFHKDKVASDGTTEYKNAIFAGLHDIIQGTGNNMTIAEGDLTVVVRFYYIVEGFDTSAPMLRAGGAGPAGYGAEGKGVKPGPATGIHELIDNGVVESVTYVNAQGMQSDKPFDGLNIVITRYSNGTTRTTKVVR